MIFCGPMCFGEMVGEFLQSATCLLDSFDKEGVRIYSLIELWRRETDFCVLKIALI